MNEHERPEPQRERPSLEPQRERLTPQFERPQPQIQRLDPRPTREPAAPQRSAPQKSRPGAQPPSAQKQSGQKQSGWDALRPFRRAAAILLLVIAGAGIVGNLDDKPAPPPTPVVMSESVPDEIVVQFNDNVSDNQIGALGQSLGIQLQYPSPFAPASKLLVAKVNPAARATILAALRASPLVHAAEPQFIYRIDQVPSSGPLANSPVSNGSGPRFVPNDPDYPRQWHMKMIGMEEAWAKTKGKGATVAVIDTGQGMMTANGVFHGKDFAQANFIKGYDFADNREPAPDGEGHGSHVTGTIAESINNGILGAGVAPEANIMELRAADDKGAFKMSSLADALHYAADHGANVVNMSLSGPNFSQIVEDALESATKKNVTLVCSTGNTGKDEVRFPAGSKECISVSAVGPGGLMAFYSTWGKETDIAGPGGDPKMGPQAEVWQETFMQRQGFFGPSGPRVDDLFPLVGTSMATPHVTGVVALLYSLGMKDPKEIRSQLRKTATPYAPADHYGAGILNAAKAVDVVQQSNNNNWVEYVLAGGVMILVLLVGQNLRRPGDPMFFVHKVAIGLAVGLFLPIGIEKLVGFGSLWNLIGHSVILAILALMVPKLDRSGFWQAFAFTLGIVIHLLLDSDSGRAPFNVYPQQKVLFWMYVNAAVGLYFAGSAYMGVRRRAAAAKAVPVFSA